MRLACAGTAVGMLLVATAISTWWHVGDLSLVEPDETTAVVLFRAPQIGEGTERLLGRAATATVAASLVVLILATRHGVLLRRGRRVVAPLVLMAGFCGACWRVATATTPGWDIGSTLLGLLVGVPVAAMVFTGLLLWAAVEYNALIER